MYRNSLTWRLMVMCAGEDNLHNWLDILVRRTITIFSRRGLKIGIRNPTCISVSRTHRLLSSRLRLVRSSHKCKNHPIHSHALFYPLKSRDPHDAAPLLDGSTVSGD